MGFDFAIEQGEPGWLHWRINAPDGQRWARGISRRNRKALEAELRKTCRRLNGGAIGINNTPAEAAQRARRRGNRNATRAGRTL